MECPDHPRCTKAFTESPPLSVPWNESSGIMPGKEPPLYLVVLILLPVFFAMDLLTTGYIGRLGGGVSIPLFGVGGPLPVLALVKGMALVSCLWTARWSDRFLKGSGFLMVMVITGWYGIVILGKLNLVLDLALAA